MHNPVNLDVIRGNPEIDLFGTTLPRSILEVTYDSRTEPKQSLILRADFEGNFIATIPLSEGFNVIEVISNNSASPEPRHQLLQLIYDSTPVNLFVTISNPQDGATVTGRVITIAGATLPGAQVVVNDIIPATTNATGRWEASIVLQPGANEITVRSVHDGDAVEATITVMR